MTQIDYKVLTAADRKNLAEADLRNAETDHYRAVLGAVDPENDPNVETHAERVKRLQKLAAEADKAFQAEQKENRA